VAKLFRKVYRILAALFRWRKTLKQNNKKNVYDLPGNFVMGGSQVPFGNDICIPY
jgi:hypothetical protein